MDENFTMGYLEEMQVFFERIAAHGTGDAAAAEAPVASPVEPPYLAADQDLEWAVDSVKLMYAAYVSHERGGAEVALGEMDESLRSYQGSSGG